MCGSIDVCVCVWRGSKAWAEGMQSGSQPRLKEQTRRHILTLHDGVASQCPASTAPTPMLTPCRQTQRPFTQSLSQPLRQLATHPTPHLHLGQVEVGPRATGSQLPGVVEEVESKVKEASGHGRAVDCHMLLPKVPAAERGRGEGMVQGHGRRTMNG